MDTSAGPSADDLRPVDLRLARLHLRLGSLPLARAELESAAGAGTLDGAALADLAEVRWRTADLAGAGEAAQAHLATGGEDFTTLVIAAEATAALGRPAEARRLVGRALEVADRPIGDVFAGIARHPIWPAAPATSAVSAGTLFGERHGYPQAPPGVRPVAVSEPEPAEDPAPRMAADQPGLWSNGAAVPVAEADPSGSLPEMLEQAAADPATELETARSELVAGDIVPATIRLAVAVRLRPALAPAVLELLAGRTDAGLELVRGDAHRLIGNHAEAARAWAAAIAALALTGQPPGPALGDGPPSSTDSPTAKEES